MTPNGPLKWDVLPVVYMHPCFTGKASPLPSSLSFYSVFHSQKKSGLFVVLGLVRWFLFLEKAGFVGSPSVIAVKKLCIESLTVGTLSRFMCACFSFFENRMVSILPTYYIGPAYLAILISFSTVFDGEDYSKIVQNIGNIFPSAYAGALSIIAPAQFIKSVDTKFNNKQTRSLNYLQSYFPPSPRCSPQLSLCPSRFAAPLHECGSIYLECTTLYHCE
jgi:hypothetical protein